MVKLRSLDLCMTGVADKAGDALRHFRALEHLNLSLTNVTA